MATTDADDTPNGWILDPASNLVLFLGEEMVIAGLTKRAIIAAQGTPAFIAFTKANLPEPSKEVTDAMRRLLQFATTDASFAEEEASAGFGKISAHHAVATWAAIEIAIEQTLVNHIRKLPQAKGLILKSAPTLSDAKIRTTTEREAKNTIREWERVLKDTTVVGRAALMLKAFGVDLVLTDQVSRALSELAELRNVILHRGGRADQKLTEKCPWMKLKAGDRVKIDDAAMDCYFDASKTFALALIAAASKSSAIQQKGPRQIGGRPS